MVRVVHGTSPGPADKGPVLHNRGILHDPAEDRRRRPLAPLIRDVLQRAGEPLDARQLRAALAALGRPRGNGSLFASLRGLRRWGLVVTRPSRNGLHGPPCYALAVVSR